MAKSEEGKMSKGADGRSPRKRITALGVIWEREDIERLQSLGEATLYSDEPQDTAEILGRIGGNEIVITGGVPISGEVIRRAPNLEMISIWGTGYNHVDVAEASKRGVVVCNVPAGTAVAVAEHAMALALALAKRLPQADNYVREGGFDWSAFWGIELMGKTFGVVGTGGVGSHVARLAGAFRCRVIAFTKHPSPERAAKLGVEYVPLDTLLEESDFICLCAALNPETEGMIGWREFELMARKPMLINVARGKIVDQKALLHALRTGQISGAGLDVLAEEPPSKDEELLREERVILTPHMAGHTPEGMANITRVCMDNIAAYLRGAPQNVVA